MLKFSEEGEGGERGLAFGYPGGEGGVRVRGVEVEVERGEEWRRGGVEGGEGEDDPHGGFLGRLEESGEEELDEGVS